LTTINIKRELALPHGRRESWALDNCIPGIGQPMKSSITLKHVLLVKAETTYRITEKLFLHVTDDELLWKPTTGKSWMTVGQLLMHCANFGCGKAVQGFVKGDWGILTDVSPENPEAVQHVPPPSMLSSVESVKEALELLNNDRILALRCIGDVEETELLAKKIIAPWGGPEVSLFQHLLLMIEHLSQHKGQLFYYLKLMGKDLSTADLWGV
jgi:hypothetical protein